MDRLSRRNVLVSEPNTNMRLDYVVDLGGHIGAAGDGKPTKIGLRYVPDKLVLDPAAFGCYLEFLGNEEWSSLERLAVTILDDVNNEVVARWVQITVSGPDAATPGVDRHGIMLEDRQPKWDNPALLSRLRRY